MRKREMSEGSSGTAGTKVREGRVGRESHGSPEGRVFRPGKLGQKYARDAWDAKARNGRRQKRKSQ
ncbi:hypothetical protein KI387_027964, partial [Taxus chinensis]